MAYSFIPQGGITMAPNFINFDHAPTIIVTNEDIAKLICSKHGMKFVLHAYDLSNPEPILFHIEKRSEDGSYVEETLTPNPNEKPISYLKRIGWFPERINGESRAAYFERIKNS